MQSEFWRNLLYHGTSSQVKKIGGQAAKTQPRFQGNINRLICAVSHRAWDQIRGLEQISRTFPALWPRNSTSTSSPQGASESHRHRTEPRLATPRRNVRTTFSLHRGRAGLSPSREVSTQLRGAPGTPNPPVLREGGCQPHSLEQKCCVCQDCPRSPRETGPVVLQAEPCPPKI